MNFLSQMQGWQKSGKYSYFPGQQEIQGIIGKYWEINIYIDGTN